MLVSLHIRNYVLIDSLEIDFPEGLIIITGQTGAGKSILLGALSLVSGAKADASVISEGADNCVVEAEWDDGTIISRVVSRTGRSRCYINDVPASVTEVAELSSRLVDIHSQHQSLLLTDHSFQLSILDNFAGNGKLLRECRERYSETVRLREALSETKEKIERLSEDLSYNEAQLRQLEAARLVPGEIEELEEEQRTLSNAEEIKEMFSRIRSIFSSSEVSGGISSFLRESGKLLERLGRFLPAMQDLAGRVDSARIELEDIEQEVEDADSLVNLSSERLAAVEDRLSTIYSLLKKHSCRTVEELVAVRDSFASSISDSGDLEEKAAELEKSLEASEKEFSSLCSRLHEARIKSSPKFSESILSSLRYLEMEKGLFEVEVSPSKPGPTGSDTATFKFSATGSSPVDVAKCASGGEISRIMLSLKSMMARFAGMPTMIFDEIDTGVSGSVADKMGSMICEMGRSMQVFAITHLPQVAAKGDAHYLVSKSEVGGKTVSGLKRLEGEERVMEVARLLSGASITPEAVANARALLDVG